MIKRLIMFLVLFLVIINIAEAVKIHGNVYDINLDLLKNVIVNVNSQPEQSIVAKEGVYSFNLNPGIYILNAEYYEDDILIASTSEEIEIEEEGDYVIDLILFPVIDDDLNDTDIVIDDPYEDEKGNWYLWIIMGLIVILVGLIVWKKPKKKTKLELAEDLQKVIEIIKSNNGRTTQKEIRKVLGLSEAKVSLMITELEEKGVVRKIKKGRGNVIILNRKN